MIKRFSKLVLELWLAIVVFVAAWFLTAGSQSPFAPPLAEILRRSRELWLGEQLWIDVMPSLGNLAAGYLIASLLGVGLGVLLGGMRQVADAVDPLLQFWRSLPGITLVPVFMVVFGIGTEMKIAFIVFGCLWPVLINTVDGVRSIDPQVEEVCRVHRITGWNRLSQVVLPAASPQIVAGLRTGLSIGIVLIVASEMFASVNGIGHFIVNAQRTFAITDMWAGTLLLGLIGYMTNTAFRGFEHAVLRWHTKRRTVLSRVDG